jgi:transketolase
VLAALADARASGDLVRFVHLAPREMPGSGKPAELLAAAGIDAAHIADAVKDLAG